MIFLIFLKLKPTNFHEAISFLDEVLHDIANVLGDQG